MQAVSSKPSISLNAQAGCENDIPMPIVTLNRSIMFTGSLLAIILQQPLITTFLFLILLPAVIWGQKRSLIFQTGKRLLAKQIVGAEGEDRRIMRFNNGIALTLLGLAQVAFLLGVPLVGYSFAAMIVAASGAALAGFCFGCFLYYQFKLNRWRLLGTR